MAFYFYSKIILILGRNYSINIKYINIFIKIPGNKKYARIYKNRKLSFKKLINKIISKKIFN